MKQNQSVGWLAAICMAAFLMPLSVVPAAAASGDFTDPSTTQSFDDAIAGMSVIRYYAFGTNSDRNINNIDQLAEAFSPYGLASTAVINDELERYQPFGPANFVFKPTTLDLTATIPKRGGLFAGGINSGQIWSREGFQPGVTGYTVYAFVFHMKIPNGDGMWPAAWFYSTKTGKFDSSEIDAAEFMMEEYQNSYDWGGPDHGPGLGSDIFSRKKNKWVWHPGIDFSAAYHDYELIWTPDATYKYVDGLLVYAERFNWTSQQPAQFGINLAVGSTALQSLGLYPTSLGEFPSALSIEHIGIWAK